MQKSGREISSANREHLDGAKASLDALAKHLEIVKAHCAVVSAHLAAVGATAEPDHELSLSAAKRHVKVAELAFANMGDSFGHPKH